MVWLIAVLGILALLALLTWWFGRRRPVTADELERQRRRLGMNDAFKGGGGGYSGPGGGG